MNATRIHSLRASYRVKLRERLTKKGTAIESGCIEWTGRIDRWGYGMITVVDDEGRRRYTGSHRAAWLAFIGPIEGQLVVDHKCRNRACMNVDHLRLVTNAENVKVADHSKKKGRSGRKLGAAPGCGKHGMEDGRWYKDKRGYTRWACRICRRAAVKRHRERQASMKSAD